MITETRSRVVLSSTLCAWAFLAAGCVQPLGPGFHFSDRHADIHASSDTPGTLQVRDADRLENAGDRTLSALDVRLPEGPNFGAQNVRITIEGKEVSPQPDSTVDLRMMRIPFDPSWQQRQPREIVAEWEFTPGPSARGTVAAAPDGFYLADETALPLWQVPAGVFARGDPNPDHEALTVFAPPEFRVLAPGKLIENKADGNIQVRTFRIRPDKDFLPYVVAGRYQEQFIRTRHAPVRFWTFGALGVETAKRASARISSSMQTFVDFFGPLPRKKVVASIVESPDDLPSEFGLMGDPGGTAFPEGVLLDSGAIAQGVANESVLQLIEYELARTWFGWRVRPTPEAQVLMGRGVGLFGLVIAAEARESGPQGASQRHRMISSLLDRYDRARSIAPDRRLMESAAGYSRAERISNGYRAALFFVALEDVCGRDNLSAAFRYIVKARAGDETGYEEFRAALESASHRDLAEIFRRWLIQPGVPDDFRARYAGTSNALARTK